MLFKQTARQILTAVEDSNTFTIKKIKLVSFTVAAGALLLTWQCTGHHIPLSVQLAFLGISIMITGIPHGALDHLVQQEQARRNNGHFHLLFFLARYLAVMLVYALTWFLFPQFSLLFFLLISCWHFGETDISLMPQYAVVISALRFLYGISILIWILLTHKVGVTPVLQHMVNINSPMYKGWIVIAAHASWLIPVAGVIMFTSLIVTTFIKQGNRYNYLLLLQLIVILLLVKWLPLLPAFALYFSGWHSLITLFNINRFITSGLSTGNKSFLSLWLKGLPFSLIAIVGLFAVGYLLKNHAPLFDPIPLLFVFLSLITLPHMEVMHKLNNSAFR
jgi:Brp/Blh family beta-carotene 15,15'-monooxygenase